VKQKASTNPILLLLVLACVTMPQVSMITPRSLRVPPAIVLEISRASADTEFTEIIFFHSAIDTFKEDGKLLMVPSEVMKIPDSNRDLWPGSGMQIFVTKFWMN
jgi:hypothetical protein